MSLVAIAWFAFGCHRSSGDPNADRPSSCLIEHDGGVTQCFDDIGPSAKSEGAKACEGMHGDHTFRVATPCPTEGVLASCSKGAGTDLERVERCYRDAPACEARCAKGTGVLSK
jgi:hypothetical protein